MSDSASSDHKQPTPPLADGAVIKACVAAALWPGAGHLVLGMRPQGAMLMTVQGAGIAAVATHLTAGLEPFFTNTGAFLFGLLLRALVVLHAFSVLDVYLWAVDPSGRLSPPRRRWAVLINVLAPGAGYILGRAWIRTVSGLALMVLFLYISRIQHPYLDLVFIAMQIIMGLAVYRQVRIHEAGPSHDPGEPLMAGDPLPQVSAAQIVVLVISVLAAVVFLGVALLRLPASELSLTMAQTKIVPRHDRIKIEVPRLGLSMELLGAGWQPVPQKKSAKLFVAKHHGEKVDARLQLDINPIPAFMSRQHYLTRHLPAELRAQNVERYSASELKLRGARAVQYRFTGHTEKEKRTYFLVVLPASRYACLLTFYCAESACPDLWPDLKKSRDTLRVEAVEVAQR